MKIFILKFAKGGGQIGGEYAQYAVPYTPLDVSIPQPALEKGSSRSESRSSSDKNLLGLRDLVKVFDNVKGLTNDVNYTMAKFARNIGDKVLFSLTGELDMYELVTAYYSSIADFNKLGNSEKRYNEARKLLEDNNSLNEIAVDSHGRIVVLGEDGLDSISIEQYALNPGAYQVLTNHNLLDLRDNNPSFTFRDDIYDNISGVSMDKVIDKINNIVKTLGTTKKELLSDKDRAILGGIEFIQQAAEEGLDLSLGTHMIMRLKLVTEDLVKLAEAAIRSIYQSLTPQEKALIDYHSLQSGGIESFLLNIVGSRASSSITQSELISRVFTPTGGGGKTNSSSEPKGENDNPLQDLINLLGGTVMPIKFVKADGNESIGTLGMNWTKLTEKDPGTTSISNMLNKTGIGGVVRSYGGITFGDILVPSEFLKDIMYKEGGGFTAILPAKYDTMGNLMVDLSLLDEFKEITKSITQYNQGTNEWWAEVTKKVKEKGLGLYLLGDGSIDKKQFGTFLVVEGYTTDSVLKNINPSFKDSTYMENEGSRDDVLELMKTALSQNGNTYDVDTKNWLNPFDWFGMYDDVYHANVFIPLTNNNLLAVNAWGQTIKESSALRKLADYLADYNGKLDRDINAGSDVLNQ